MRIAKVLQDEPRLLEWMAFKYGWGLEQADFRQTLAERLLRDGGRFDPARANPSTWIAAVAHRLGQRMRYYRRRDASRMPTVGVNDVPEESHPKCTIDVLDDVHQRDQVYRILDAVRNLGFREREIIKLRYGIGDGDTYTREEVGRIFKVTRERVRQVEAKAILKLQRALPDAKP